MFGSAYFGATYFGPAYFGEGSASPPPALLSLKEAIVATLGASAPLTAILGARVFPAMVPQTSPRPALCYRFISSVHDTHIRGALGMKWVRVSFEVYTFTHSDVEAVEEILRNLFQGYIGKLSGVSVAFVTHAGESDDYEEPAGGSDLGEHWKRVDFRFKVRESLPTFS